MLQVNVFVLFSVLSAKTTKIVLIVSVSVELGVEMEFFDQSQMQDLPFMNTIEHILCSSHEKRDREKKGLHGPRQGHSVESMVNSGWRLLEVVLTRVYVR